MKQIDQLIQAYNRAQEGIVDEIERAPKGSEREYADRLLIKISAILASLYVFTQKWSKKNIPQLYEDGLKESYSAVANEYKAAGKSAPGFGEWTSADEQTVRNAETKINAYLSDAINSTRARMQGIVRQAAMKAVEEAVTKGQSTRVMQANLVQMLQEKGIESVSYLRDGITCYMQLNTYAELVAHTTEHEIRNIANLNIGLRINNDLVMVSSHIGACPICVPYQGRVYSVSGADTRYPYLYSTPFSSTYQNFHPRCRHVVTQWIEDLHTPEENAIMRKNSNRSFEIGGQGWTKKQTEAAQRNLDAYRQREGRIRAIYTDRKQYEQYVVALGEDAPKTFSGFRRMKAANDKSYEDLRSAYRYVNAHPGSDYSCYKIYSELKNKGINVGFPINPEKINPYILADYSAKNPSHIMERMLERNITDDMVRSYVQNSSVMFEQWKGIRRMYVSNNGVTVVQKATEGWIAKTVWAKAGFGEHMDIIIEVCKKYGK